ncbi:helix-turn-helix domain-containing protein [Listeria monocytogenes]|uniref:helix-turn-helix domain-containing protein n=1 Tax=Listeria monocytogenes TaxID=1639 RepID=UPI003F972558
MVRFEAEPDVKIRVNILGICEKYNISMSELSKIADIDLGKLIALSKDERQRVQLAHLERICQSLLIRDARELLLIEVINEEEQG